MLYVYIYMCVSLDMHTHTNYIDITTTQRTTHTYTQTHNHTTTSQDAVFSFSSSFLHRLPLSLSPFLSWSFPMTWECLFRLLLHYVMCVYVHLFHHCCSTQLHFLGEENGYTYIHTHSLTPSSFFFFSHRMDKWIQI